jgi:hypothetical protein
MLCQMSEVVTSFDGLGMGQQRLLELKLYDASFSGTALASAVLQAVNRFALSFQGLDAVICDGASVNQAACKEMRKYTGEFLHMSCVSHGLDNIGKNMVSVVSSQLST